MRPAPKHIVPKPIRFALCLCLGLAPVWGATLEQLSLNDLIARSTLIVQAKVTGSTASYTGSTIYTHYKVSVLQQWKGASQTTLDVQIPGGAANGMRQIVPGAPQFTTGQQYVLFLWTSRTGVVSTLGFTEGVFNLTGAPGAFVATQMPTTETVISLRTGQPVNDPPIGMPLAQLVAAITGGGGN
jgi:hypothetical protein